MNALDYIPLCLSFASDRGHIEIDHLVPVFSGTVYLKRRLVYQGVEHETRLLIRLTLLLDLEESNLMRLAQY